MHSADLTHCRTKPTGWFCTHTESQEAHWCGLYGRLSQGRRHCASAAWPAGAQSFASGLCHGERDDAWRADRQHASSVSTEDYPTDLGPCLRRWLHRGTAGQLVRLCDREAVSVDDQEPAAAQGASSCLRGQSRKCMMAVPLPPNSAMAMSLPRMLPDVCSDPAVHRGPGARGFPHRHRALTAVLCSNPVASWPGNSLAYCSGSSCVGYPCIRSNNRLAVSHLHAPQTPTSGLPDPIAGCRYSVRWVTWSMGPPLLAPSFLPYRKTVVLFVLKGVVECTVLKTMIGTP